MKKYLSLVLAIALVLTTLVVPMSVSAEGEDITLSYVYTDADGEVVTEAYAGDAVKMSVKAVANTDDVSIDQSSIMLVYDKNVVSVASENTDVKIDTTYSTITYNNTSGYTISTAGVELFSVNLTIAEVTGTAVAFSLADKAPASFVTTEYEEASFVVPSQTLTIGTSSIVVKVGETVLKTTETDTFRDGTSVSVTATATGKFGAAEIQKLNTETSEYEKVGDLTDATAYRVSEAGTYKVVVTIPGKTDTEEYNFVYIQETIDAVISIVTDNISADGYTTDGVIEIPVTMSGIGTATAGMVKFDVKYDANYLTLDETSLSEKVSYTVADTKDSVTVLYGDEENADGTLTNNGTVATLKFNVNDTIAKYDNTTITLDTTNAKWCEAGDAVTPIDLRIGASKGSVTTVIKPVTFATLTGADKTAYQKDSYTITVASENGVTTQYVAGTATYETAEAAFEASNAIPEGGIPVDNDTYTYYIVSKVGSAPAAYQMTVLTPGEGEGKTNLDKTAPTVDATKWTVPETWTSTVGAGVTLTLPEQFAVDAGAGLAGYKIYNGEELLSGDTAVTNWKVPAGANVEKLNVVAVDTVGNEAEAVEITVKYDGVAPEKAELSVGNFTNENTKVISITNVDGGLSGVAKVELYKDSTLVQAITANAGVYEYETNQEGTYYVIVTDGAGNTSTSESLVVSMEKISASNIQVAIVKDAEAKTGFVQSGVGNNGTFTYVKIKPVAQTDVDDTLTFTVGGEDVDVTADAEGYYVIDGTAEETTLGEYTLTVASEKKDDANNAATATYKFTVVGTQEAMKSATNDAYYNALDYVRVRNLVGESTDEVAPTADAKLEGGLFSADVDGTLGYGPNDVSTILSAIRNGKFVGIYNFAIMNGVVTENASPMN